MYEAILPSRSPIVLARFSRNRGINDRVYHNLLFLGGQGQNQTADTGIFRSSEINKLLIILEQGVLGTVRDYFVDSIGYICVGKRNWAVYRACTEKRFHPR